MSLRIPRRAIVIAVADVTRQLTRHTRAPAAATAAFGVILAARTQDLDTGKPRREVLAALLTDLVDIGRITQESDKATSPHFTNDAADLAVVPSTMAVAFSDRT